jgi:AbrB family looped-hinge helix DNA binding protein
MRATIDAAGRIVVPKVLRDELGLRGGQEVMITVRDGRLEVEVPPVAMRLERRAGLAVAVPDEPLPSLSAGTVREALERIRR